MSSPSLAPAPVLLAASLVDGDSAVDAPPAALRVEDPGGSALLGGVMMRCGSTVGMAARRPDGTIATSSFELAPPSRARWARLPVVRGVIAVGASLTASLPALAWSFKVRAPQLPFPDVVRMRRSALVGLLVADAVFAALPALLVATTAASTGFALVGETAMRIGLLLAYLVAVRLHPDVRELFAYHGAEHKTVAAYEACQPLTVASVRPHSLRHVRCGTGFVLWLLVAASLATPLTHGLPLVAAIGARALLMVAAAGVAYEVLQLGNRFDHVRPVRLLLAPGMALQRLTTSEPTDAQLEVGIAAFEAALDPSSVDRSAVDAPPVEDERSGMTLPAQRSGTGAGAPLRA